MNIQKKKDIWCFITRFELIFCSTLQFQLAAINRYLPFQYFFLGKTIFQFQQQKPKRMLLWQPLFFKLRLDTFHTSLNRHYDTQSYKKKKENQEKLVKRGQRCPVTLDLSINQRKTFYWQGVSETCFPKKKFWKYKPFQYL